MYSEHTSAMTQQLVAAGMAQQQANIIADTIGQCMAKLTHRGPIEMLGPLTLGGPVRSLDGSQGQSARFLFNGRDAYFSMDNMTGTPSAAVLGRIFSIYTLGADLNADASVVAGGKTYVNSFCRDTYKFASGTTVGAINGGNDTYYIIAADACEVPQ